MKLQSALKRIESRYGPDSPNANPLKFGILGWIKLANTYCTLLQSVNPRTRIT